MRSSAPLGRWGDLGPEHRGLRPRTRAFIEGVLGPAVHAALPGARELPDLRISLEAFTHLFEGLSWDASVDVRARHCRGMSYVDLLTWRTTGELASAPDAVVFPRDHDQVLEILARCSRERIAVVPVGGGTSVTGGIDPGRIDRPVVVVSLERMDRFLDLDATSNIASVQAGITGPQVEEHLGAFTLGHFPQSWERASIGGYIAARSSGQSSSGYGRIEDMLVGATVATPVGTWNVGGFPASSTGPDLRHVVLGSEGAFGVITEARLRVRPRPTIREYHGAIVPGDFAAGAALMRTLTRSPLRPTVLRISDPSETAATLAMSAPDGLAGVALDSYLRIRGAKQGNLVIIGWEGTDPDWVRTARAFARTAIAEANGVSLGSTPGRAWAKERFHGPFLRDELMDSGYLVETFETAVTWANVDRVHERISLVAREALGEPSYVMAHMSHSYDTGASLYFTVLAGGVDVPERAAQRWRAVKRDVTDAIVGEGAAISHHHGIGRDHAKWLPGQVGPIGMDVLRAIKHSVDPHGIMNPGALIGGEA